MNWTGRIIAIVLTIVFAGFLANLISKLVVQGLHTWTEWITSVLSGGAGLEGMVKLGVYLIVITLLIRFITRRNG
jgi:hypothetical protein